MGEVFSVGPCAGIHIQEFRQQLHSRFGSYIERLHEGNRKSGQELHTRRQAHAVVYTNTIACVPLHLKRPILAILAERRWLRD